jgi:hypothetical protein
MRGPGGGLSRGAWYVILVLPTRTTSPSLAIFVTDPGGALVDITETDGEARQELVATAPPHFLVYSGDHQIDVSSPSPALPAVSGP